MSEMNNAQLAAAAEQQVVPQISNIEHIQPNLFTGMSPYQHENHFH